MNKAVVGVVGVVLLAGSFYGGMVYGKNSVQNQSNNRRGNFSGMNFQGGNFPGGGRNGGNGAVNGDILSVGQNTFTVKLRDGGSKIVIFSPSTTVRAIQDVPQNVLQIGKNVIVAGTPNPDGSVTAQVVQVRDTSSTPFGAGRLPQQ